MTTSEKNFVEDKLRRFAHLLGCLVCHDAEYFRCWHHIDYDNFKQNDNLYYVLTKTEEDERLNDVSLLFSINKKTFALKLFVENIENDNFIIYRHDTIIEMSEENVYQMLKKFEEIMKPWFDAINEIKKLEAAKTPHINIMNDIIKNVFHWK